MKIFQFPLIKITLFFVLGILFGYYYKFNLYWVLGSVTITLLLLLFLFYPSQKNQISNHLFGISALILSMMVGISNQMLHSHLHQKNHYANLLTNDNQEHTLEISINEKLKNSPDNHRFIAKITTFDNKLATGNVILNIRKDSSSTNQVIIGNQLKIKELVYKNKPIKNPNQFDYGKYLENKNIYGQVYCNENEILIAPTLNKNIWYYTAQFRNRIIQNLEKNGFGKNELSVIVALILGQQQDISPEILHNYQFAGAIHILSVSGLHVGFILLFVEKILKNFPNTKKWKFSKLLIVLLCLWIFGFIAGLAPSVLRSVVMFSFVAVGRHLKRGVNIFNTLLVSALIILFFEPSFLFDVGFQLSYISLFFIVWLQPYFSKFWQPKTKVTKTIWEILTVSVAAQVGAMGISIYYFHQFPGLFFLTNLIILPAMGIILGYGVFVMFLAYFDMLPVFLMKILEYSIWFLNKIIAWIASFEGFIIKDIPMNKLILLGLYLMIVGVFIYLKKRSFNKLIFGLITIIIFQISLLVSKQYYQNQKELIVFNERKKSLIALRSGQQTKIYTDACIQKNISKNNNLNQYLVGNFSKISSKKTVPSLLFFNNKKIMIIDSCAVYPKNINPEIVIISHSPRINLDRFLENCQPKTIVADASNFKSYVKIWQKTCRQKNISFHSTAEKGFFRLE